MVILRNALMAAASMYDFPPEVLDTILSWAEPAAVAAFAQTCRLHRATVYNAPDQHLWRSLYLAQDLDDPRVCVDEHLKPFDMAHFDWKRELQCIMRVRTVGLNPKACRPGEISSVLEILLSLCTRYPIASAHSNAEPVVSLNLLWAAALLTKGALLDAPVCSGLPHREAQLCARLHTMFGLTELDRTHAQRVRSRAYVYDMRRYSADNRWGPFAQDRSGKVDWELVCALHHVMSMHIVDMIEDPHRVNWITVSPMSMGYCQPRPRIFQMSDKRDWAGVTGDWWVSFAFCDHRELLSECLCYSDEDLSLTFIHSLQQL